MKFPPPGERKAPAPRPDEGDFRPAEGEREGERDAEREAERDRDPARAGAVCARRGEEGLVETPPNDISFAPKVFQRENVLRFEIFAIFDILFEERQSHFPRNSQLNKSLESSSFNHTTNRQSDPTN